MSDMVKGKKIIVTGIVAALTFWLFESFIHSYFLYDGTLIRQIILPSGHELWMRSSLLILFLAFCYHCQLKANKQKHTELVLKKSEEKYRELFDSINSGVVVYEATENADDFIINDFNQASEKIENIRREDIIGKSLLSVFPGVKAFGLFDVFQRVWKTGISEDFPVTMYTDDRISGWRDNHVYKLSSGEIVAVYTDETDRMQAEEALRDSEARFRTLFYRSSDANMLLIDGVHVDCNNASLEMLKATRDQIIGKSPTFFSPERQPDGRLSVEAAAEKIREIMENGSARFEWIHRRMDGTEFWTEVVATAMDIDGRACIFGVWRNITDRKNAERAQRESEGKYRLIADNVHDAIWVMGMDQRFTYLSPSIEKLTGFTREEMFNIKLADRLTPASYELAINTLANELESEESGNMDMDRSAVMELEEYHKNGHTIWTEVTASFLRDNEGKSHAVIGVTRDIRERKASEKEMQSLQERFLKVFNISPVATSVSTLTDGMFVEANKACYDLIGYKRDDIIDRTAEDLKVWVNPNERDKIADIMSKDGTIRNLEVPLRTASGAVKDCLFSADIIKLGEERHMLSVAVDITDRKRTEERLQAGHDKFQAIFAGIGDGIAIINQDYTIETHNDHFYNFFGNSKGKKCYEVLLGKTEPCDHCPFHLDDKSEKIHTNEFVTKSGRYFDASLSLFYDVDKQAKIVALFKDVTERKKIEGEAIRLDRLAAIGELASGVAHEINNPITGVINYAELLKDDLMEQNLDYHLPEKIIKEGERIAHIVRNLLPFSRDRKEEFSKVMLKNIFNDSLHLLKKQMSNEGIAVRVNISDDTPLVIAKTQEIQQVFLNIISNSRYALNQKFSNPDKRKIIEINSETIHIKDRPYVRIIVYDRGEGIREDLMDKICNPFFTTKPSGKGTGLGLNICHGIIEDHDGMLKFESVVGEYTKVIIDLPVFESEDSKLI